MTGIFIPAQVPEPIISLIDDITSRARVNPSPIPAPSSADSPTVCSRANISALPRIMQFTTMSARYIPSRS